MPSLDCCVPAILGGGAESWRKCQDQNSCCLLCSSGGHYRPPAIFLRTKSDHLSHSSVRHLLVLTLHGVFEISPSSSLQDGRSRFRWLQEQTRRYRDSFSMGDHSSGPRGDAGSYPSPASPALHLTDFLNRSSPRCGASSARAKWPSIPLANESTSSAARTILMR